MSRITVIGGTGYAGSAIVTEAAGRGHQVTALSRSLPGEQIPHVTYLQADASDESALATAFEGADVVVDALAPRGQQADTWRGIHRTVGRAPGHRRRGVLAAPGTRGGPLRQRPQRHPRGAP